MSELEYYPLLPQQLRLVSYELKKSSKGVQNAGLAIEFKGLIDRKRLDYALKRVGEVHDALGMRLAVSETGILIHEITDRDPHWENHDYCGDIQGEKLEFVLKDIRKKNLEPMDIFDNPMFEFHLYQLGFDWVVLYIKANHIIIDGPSFRALYVELCNYYSAGEGSNLNAPMLWSRFIENELSHVQSTAGQSSISYWKNFKRLSLEPVTKEEIAKVSFSGAELQEICRIPIQTMKNVARKEKTSIFSLALFCYTVALAKLFDRSAFCVNYTLTNRFTEEMKYTVGLSTHYIPHMISKIKSGKIRDMFFSSKQQLEKGFQHFMVGEYGPASPFVISYLSETMKLPAWENMSVQTYPISGCTNFGDMSYTLMCTETEDTLDLSVIADENIYKPEFHNALFTYFMEIMRSLEDDVEESGISIIEKTNDDENIFMLTNTQKDCVNKEYPDHLGGHNLINAVILKGKYDINRLNAALKKLSIRHDAMKMILSLDNEERYLFIDNDISPCVEVVTLITKGRENRLTEAMKDASERIKQPLMISKDGMYRFWAYEITQDEVFIVHSVCHLVSDGASLGIFNQELELLYENPERTDLPPCGSFKQFLIDKEQIRKKPEYKEQEKYWKERWKGYVEPNIIVPKDSAKRDLTDEEAMIVLEKDNIVKIARACKTSNFNIIFLMWQMALAETIKRNDVILSYAFAARFKVDYQRTIGMLTHLVAVRSGFSIHDTWRQIVRDFKQLMEEDMKNIDAADAISDAEFSMSYVPFNGTSGDAKFANLDVTPVNLPSLFFGGRYLAALVSEQEKHIIIFPRGDFKVYGADFILSLGNAVRKYIDKILENPNITLADLWAEKVEVNTDKEDVLSILKESWKSILELEDMPELEDDFFELGGNSYKAFFMLENMPEKYKGRMGINDIYEYETLAKMAECIVNKTIKE